MDKIRLAHWAKLHGICDPGMQKILEAKDIQGLIDYYLEGIDFCLRNNFPTVDFMKENAGVLLESNGIYTDGKIDLTNPLKVVLLDRVSANIKVDDYKVSDIYVKHECDLQILVKDNAFASIEAYDNCTVNITLEGDARAYLAVYDNAFYFINESENSHIKINRKGSSSWLKGGNNE